MALPELPALMEFEHEETPEEYEERKKKVQEEITAKYEAEKERLLNNLVTVTIELVMISSVLSSS